MNCCYTYYSSDQHYLKSPIGCLKCLNIVLGAISLALLSCGYLPVLEDQFSLGVVIVSLIISTIYFVIYAVWPKLRYFLLNRRLDNAYHLLVGFLLILAGIDLGQLIGSSGKFVENIKVFKNDDELDRDPGYVKGAAKIFMFINGVLYEIIGFIRVKGEDESWPLDFDGISLDEVDARRRSRDEEQNPLLSHQNQLRKGSS